MNVYYESKMSLTNFLDMVERVDTLKKSDSCNGKKCWDYISGEVCEGDSKDVSGRITDGERRSLLSLVESMNLVIKSNNPEDRNSDNLSSCQEAAIAVGEYLEQIIGEDSEIIRDLEMLCEVFFRMNENRDEGLVTDAKALISNTIRAIESLPKKYTVFFLPYKYSMWDSLESIWQAACEDDRWEVSVCPIPYFQRNEDGSLGEICYEGSQYKDVPLVAFNTINLGEIKPDAIFIHNPYDEYNIVTMVHPDYFAAELKKHTNMLVYVPYYMPLDDIEGEESIVVPGVLFADRVIIHTKELRDFFVDVLYNWLKESRSPLKKPEIAAKFFVCPTPKLDKFFSDSYSMENLPADWKKKIYSGYIRKKVLVCDTHVGLVMAERGERTIKKLTRVFDMIEKRGDVVIIWRPHPLVMETIKSMNPGLEKSYKALVERIKGSSWGIFDDTPDMNVSLHASDASYNGGGGSMPKIYKYSGKPYIVMDLDAPV